MTAQDRTTNKNRYETGDQPAGSDYVDLIDSFISIADTTVQSLSSDLIAPTLVATTEVSAPLVRVTTVSASTGYFATLSVTTVSGANADFALVSAQRINASAATFLALVSANAIHASSMSITGDLTFTSTFEVTSAVVSASGSPAGSIPVSGAAGFLVVQVSGQTVGIPYFKVSS